LQGFGGEFLKRFYTLGLEVCFNSKKHFFSARNEGERSREPARLPYGLKSKFNNSLDQSSAFTAKEIGFTAFLQVL